jgi:transcriptional regulator with XRE-family HTH domain
MLSGVLTGKQTNPSLAVLRKLATALGVNVGRLLE